MYEMPNNRERRRIAKSLGLLEKRSNLPYKKYAEEISRSIAAGKEIYRQKTEEMLRSIEEQEDAIFSGSRQTQERSVSPKRQIILDAMNQPGEKRSYNEISADIELQSWSKRKF